MALKFESISNRIHWSLALKSALVGVAWYTFSFPFFALLAAVLYLVPLFNPLRFSPPFLAMLVLGALLPSRIVFSLFFACTFYLILGIKDLVLVKRTVAHEALTLLFLLGFSVFFFSRFPTGVSGGALVFTLLGAVILAFLVRGFFAYRDREELRGSRLVRNERDIASIFYGLFMGEGALVMLLIPMNSTLRTALFFLAAIVGFEVLAEHVSQALTWQRTFGYLALLFTLTLLMFIMNQWGLS